MIKYLVKIHMNTTSFFRKRKRLRFKNSGDSNQGAPQMIDTIKSFKYAQPFESFMAAGWAGYPRHGGSLAAH